MVALSTRGSFGLFLAGNKLGRRRLSLGSFVVLGDNAQTQFASTLGASAVAAWADSFVIAKTLCPWAARSKRKGELFLVSSEASTEDEAFNDVHTAAKVLLAHNLHGAKSSSFLGTTLVAFESQSSSAWAADFGAFDAFVRRAQVLIPGTSLVAFHPEFNRWRDLPLVVGDEVQAHRLGTYVDQEAYEAAELAAQQRNDDKGVDVDCIYRRTEDNWPAIVVGVDESIFGVRSARLRFLVSPEYYDDDAGDGDEDGYDAEETVPIDWIVNRPGFDDSLLLADNKLNRSPVPVVHILRSDVLAKETEAAGTDSLFELQFRNARLMRSPEQVK